MIKIILLTIIQNASFTLVSRARNSKSITFHAGASIISNLTYILVLKEVVTDLTDTKIIIGYVIGSVIGSVAMHYVSMNFIEKRFKK